MLSLRDTNAKVPKVKNEYIYGLKTYLDEILNHQF